MSRYGVHDVWNRIPYLNYDLSGKLDFDASVSVPGTKIGNWQRLTLLEDKGKQRERGPKNCILQDIQGKRRCWPRRPWVSRIFEDIWRFLRQKASFIPSIGGLCVENRSMSFPETLATSRFPVWKVIHRPEWFLPIFSFPIPKCRIFLIPIDCETPPSLTVSFWEIGLCQGGEIGSDRTH